MGHPKNSVKKLFLSTFALLISVVAIAQDELGQSLSNYSPTTTMRLNPATLADSKVFLDIHLLGVGLSAHNDFVYMPGDFRWRMLWQDPESIPDPQYNRNKELYSAHAHVNVQLPTVSLVVGRNAFAINSAVRSFTDARDLPDHLANYAIEGFQWSEQMGQSFESADMRVSSLNFAQVGLSYARILKASGNEMMNAGITVNRLIGIAGASLLIDEWNYSVLDSTDLLTTSISGEYGVNEPAFNSGSGWGIDLGFIYKKTRGNVDSYVPHSPRNGCKTSDYVHKLGVSLLDIGRISFDPVFYSGNFSNDSDVVWEDYSEADPEDLDELIDLLDEELGASNSSSSEPGGAEKFRMAMPTSLSVQYDRWIKGAFYIGSVWVQGFPRKNRFGPQRLSQLSVIPRLEWKRFEFALPLVLRDYNSPSFGAMLRINSIIIGTDRLGAFLGGNNNKYGADIYAHFKYSIFRRAACNRKGGRSKGRSSGRGGGRVPPCPSW